MNWKETYTKVFLKQAGIAISESSLAEYMPVWWQNTREKDSGGLRLTEAGLLFLMEKIELATYDIPFPPDFKITTQVVIFLDKFIDCPYFLTNKGLTVTNEKKALELHLFSGDVRKYGLAKALKRTDESVNP
jgi:hypothetical protein|tara:strand:+ start:7088 stop:7483 length:396 start_codon:yes stop_codon:yes gene_type:complete